MARSLAMTFLALTLLLLPALAYGDEVTEFQTYYDEALSRFVDEIDRSQHEGARFDEKTLACLHKQAQALAVKVARMRMGDQQLPEHDEDIDAGHGWDECFNQ